jgi:hypothetical protein
MLRSGALRDRQVIDAINRDVVPVWVDVRHEAIPDVPALQNVLFVGKLDEHRRVKDGFNGGFYLRSMVLTPDGARVLNPQPDTYWGSIGNYWATGHYSYAQTDPDDYLSMLGTALDHYRFCKEHPLAACL